MSSEFETEALGTEDEEGFVGSRLASLHLTKLKLIPADLLMCLSDGELLVIKW